MKKLIISLIVWSIGLSSLYFIASCKELPKTEKTGVWLSNGAQIEIIKLDSCEYLWYNGQSQTALAHKGNCKNH